jgi:hypothetical protein
VEEVTKVCARCGIETTNSIVCWTCLYGIDGLTNQKILGFSWSDMYEVLTSGEIYSFKEEDTRKILESDETMSAIADMFRKYLSTDDWEECMREAIVAVTGIKEVCVDDEE